MSFNTTTKNWRIQTVMLKCFSSPTAVTTSGNFRKRQTKQRFLPSAVIREKSKQALYKEWEIRTLMLLSPQQQEDEAVPLKGKKKNDFQHALQYLGVMVHPQCQCGWLSNHHGNTPLGCLSGYFQKGWTEDGRSTQNVGTTIDWAVMPGWLQRKLAGYQHLLPSAVWPRTQWPGSWGSMLSLLVGNCTLRS